MEGEEGEERVKTPDEFLACLRQAKVGIEFDDSIPTAAAALTPDGYRIKLGQLYKQADDDGKLLLLRHELSHIVRGDCLLPIKQMAEQENRLPQQVAADVNRAADACINEGLDKEKVKALGGLLYADLGLENMPSHPPGWRPIYDAMKEQGKDSGGWDDILECLYSDPAEAIKAHVRTVLDLRDTPIGKEASMKVVEGRKRTIPPASPLPMPLVSRILKALPGHRGLEPQVSRTWARPGRTPWTRGAKRIPRLKVLVGADVSGSMSPELETLSAAVAWLRRSHDVVLACWDTEARITKHIEATGGGTYIQPLWRLAKEQRAEAIVVLTDGYIEGINPMPNVPVIWVITKEGKKPTLRPGDSAIDL